ncbi:MAG: hypothetical protein KJ949_02620 [Nanoarchaeota archaeon]|nr:hypothetical protein [Nanoarchaeota archaeon]
MIIILLVIAAIGIIWAVVNPFIKGAGDDIASQTDCMALDIKVQKAVCEASGDNCNVTLKRGSDGGKAIAGVNLLFYNADVTESYPYNFIGDISENGLSTTNATISPGTDMGENATTLSIVPYFTDGSGNPAYCSETGSYNVVNA